MSEERSLYSWLFDKSEEEKEIETQIKEEVERFESTEFYKKHQEKLDALYEKSSEAFRKRAAEGRRHRKPVVPKDGKELSDATKETKLKVRKSREEKFAALPENIQKLVKEYEALSDSDKRAFNWFSDSRKSVSDRFDPVVNRITTDKNINELHYILVQTVIDYINDNSLTDINEIHFSADGLKTSAQYGEWTPETDSYLGIYGLEKEGEGEYDWVRRFIGEDL